MYGLDFRKRVLSRYAEGDLGAVALCKLFGITFQTFSRWRF